MKTIIHLSDLHFGKVDQKRVAPLISEIKRINPNLIVISGDFTQRATEKEFIEAKTFIQSLGYPVFVIPGNHDIPLYNIWRRFKSPFKKYLDHIGDTLTPYYEDEEVALIGVNSVRRFAVSSGKIDKNQLKNIEERVKKIDSKLIKIIVCHHPFELPSLKNIEKKTSLLTKTKKYTHNVVSQGKALINTLSKHSVDLFLTGHLHVHNICDTTVRYKTAGYSALIIQAGTAISMRSRGEPVSFNVLHVEKPHLSIEHYEGDYKTPNFILCSVQNFAHQANGWKKIDN